MEAEQRRSYTGATAEAELDALAKKRAQETGESYAVAYTAVLEQNPKLYRRYVDEAEAAKRRG